MLRELWVGNGGNGSTACYYSNGMFMDFIAAFRPTERIADVWKVVEKLRDNDLYLRLEDYSSGYKVEFIDSDSVIFGRASKNKIAKGICLAALKTLNIEIEKETK